ncbi:MAG: hypothetical protein U5K00_10750 [Melioribacteraceae bacterium]|nr:hypothetical protein [Melioribacteraceae bacterium]
MKTLLIGLIFSIGISINAQESEALSKTVGELFAFSKNKNYQAVCSLIAFSGENSSRKYKSSLNPKSKSELDQGKRIAKKIKAYLDISDSHKILRSSSETVDETQLQTLVIAFTSGSQQLKIPFKFVKVEDKFLLVDID